jgi:hypothetical protein
VGTTNSRLSVFVCGKKLKLNHALKSSDIIFITVNAARAGVAQSVQCLTTDWTARVRTPTEAEDFSSNLCVRTGSGAHPASCTVGTGGKARPGRDADHPPPSSAEVKKEYELYVLSWRVAGPFYIILNTALSLKLCFLSGRLVGNMPVVFVK